LYTALATQVSAIPSCNKENLTEYGYQAAGARSAAQGSNDQRNP
jgi:hypothetical protein